MLKKMGKNDELKKVECWLVGIDKEFDDFLVCLKYFDTVEVQNLKLKLLEICWCCYQEDSKSNISCLITWFLKNQTFYVPLKVHKLWLQKPDKSTSIPNISLLTSIFYPISITDNRNPWKYYDNFTL